MDKLRCVRTRFCLANKVQIHHVIPRQHKNFLREIGYHENDPANLIFMPTRHGMQSMNLREDRFIHDGGHPRYNKYVGKLLQNATDALEILFLQTDLKRRIRIADPDLPWF